MRSATNLIERLSGRELEVLILLADDKKDRVIAKELKITERTVRSHVARILLKLGVESRVGAAVAFTEWRLRQGLSSPTMSSASTTWITPGCEAPRPRHNGQSPVSSPRRPSNDGGRASSA